MPSRVVMELAARLKTQKARVRRQALSQVQARARALVLDLMDLDLCKVLHMEGI